MIAYEKEKESEIFLLTGMVGVKKSLRGNSRRLYFVCLNDNKNGLNA